MADYDFPVGTIIIFNSQQFVVLSRSGSSIGLRNMQTNQLWTIHSDELIKHHINQELTIITDPKDIEQVKLNELTPDFTNLPEHLKDEAKRRYAYTTAIVKAKLSTLTKRSLEPIILKVSREVNDLNPPSWSTLRRWYIACKNAGFDIRALIPKYHLRGRRSKIQPRVREIIEEKIESEYLTRQRKPVKAVYHSVLRQIKIENEDANYSQKLKIPSEHTVYRFINKLDPYEVMVAREGKKVADRIFRATEGGIAVSRPLERVEFDHTPLDLIVVDENTMQLLGRPYFTSIVDVYSKTFCGFYVDYSHPSYLSVMQCLKHAINNKNYIYELYPDIKKKWENYGIPGVLITDNAPEFKSAHLKDACRQLNIELLFNPPRVPWYKPHIERLFRTVQQDLIHQLRGTTFSNIFKRGDYNPEKDALISLEAFMRMLHLWIVDIYHHTLHKGLNDTPARVWASGIKRYPPEVPPNLEALNILLGRKVERTLFHYGIELFGLKYNSKELGLLRRRLYNKTDKVIVKVDETDISTVYVWDSFNNKYIVVPAIARQYASGLTLFHHNVLRRFARMTAQSKVDIHHLIDAKERLAKLIEEEYSKNKKLKRKIVRLKKGVSNRKKSTDLILDPSRKKGSYLKSIVIEEGDLDTTDLEEYGLEG